MQCACAILSSVVCYALQYSSTLSHKSHGFGKKKKGIEYKMCVLLLSTNFALDMFSFEEELGEI